MEATIAVIGMLVCGFVAWLVSILAEDEPAIRYQSFFSSVFRPVFSRPFYPLGVVHNAAFCWNDAVIAPCVIGCAGEGHNG